LSYFDNSRKIENVKEGHSAPVQWERFYQWPIKQELLDRELSAILREIDPVNGYHPDEP
jgi:hypothetical protein